MDIFDEEIIAFWKSLASNGVRYMTVGGYAVNLHGHQRFTEDMDLWIEDTKENRANLRKAFDECVMGDYFMLETMQIVPGWTDFRLNNGLRLDLHIKMKGLEGYTFDECMNMATIAEINHIKVPFIHINQLIANKKAVNRPKDQLDIAQLEKIVQLRQETGPD
jgi:predicted nucleotidyltransferase